MSEPTPGSHVERVENNAALEVDVGNVCDDPVSGSLLTYATDRQPRRRFGTWGLRSWLSPISISSSVGLGLQV